MTAARQRKVQRAAHLAAGLLIVAYVYGPNAAQFQNPIRFIVLPLLALTGLAMWQAPRIRRLRTLDEAIRRALAVMDDRLHPLLLPYRGVRRRLRG